MNICHFSWWNSTLIFVEKLLHVFLGWRMLGLPVKALVIALARGVSASDKVSFYALFGVIPVIMGT